MNCVETQKLMTGFVEDELKRKELRAFLEHVRVCESCREDLEVYYTLFSGMKMLDGDKDFSTKDSLDFEKKLKKMEDLVRIRTRRSIQKRVAIVIFAIVVSFFL